MRSWPQWRIWRVILPSTRSFRLPPCQTPHSWRALVSDDRNNGSRNYTSLLSAKDAERKPPTTPKTHRLLSKPGKRLKKKDHDSAKDYIRQLDLYLPHTLRLTRHGDVTVPASAKGILTVLGKAQSDPHASGNILARIVTVQERPGAALYLIDKILKDVSANHSEHGQQVPSAISWPFKLSSTALSQPVELSRPASVPFRPDHSLEGQYEALASSGAFGVVHIWRFLGSLVIESANLKPEAAARAMSVVYQILAKLHHLNLIPDNIYNHVSLAQSSAVQRPPILDLLHSRILSTLSDATWRSYQDEAMSQAVKTGIDYQKTQDPPGGRFRLKVRDLGPEIWLEFILWCCVETDCAQAGVNLVSLLGKQTSDPWFAVSWVASGDDHAGVRIDWDRVQMRTGGTVGRIEGYSSEKPLAEVLPRTISVEVVKALVESSIDAANAKDVTNQRLGGMLPKTIQTLVSFLEPHSLCDEYFDYLTARLLSAMSNSFFQRPLGLQSLADTITHVRSLEPSGNRGLAPVGMNFRSIVQQSELYAGMLHVTMHTLGCTGHMRQSIDTFDYIQSLVDGSKMQAIASFINIPAEQREGFFNAAPTSGDIDFTMSHGQVPYSRIAAFLNLLTDNDIVPLAEWLIYSTDPDGPLLPGPSFQRTSVASALVRFAGANDDPQLLQYVLAAMRFRKLKPPVSLLRLLANAQVQCLNLQAARACLNALRPAIAGGFHPDNVACLAASILRLEARTAPERNPIIVQDHLADARSLLEDMLDGQFDGNAGDFYTVQRQLFKQQVGHVLRICENVASLFLNQVAFAYRDKFLGRNEPKLSPQTFNILLRGIVEVAGADEGVRIWELFCKDTPQGSSPIEDVSFDFEAADLKSRYHEVDFAGHADNNASTLDEPSTEAEVSDASDQTSVVEDAFAIAHGVHDEHAGNAVETPGPVAPFLPHGYTLNQAAFRNPFEDFIKMPRITHVERPSDSEQQSTPLPVDVMPQSDDASPAVIPNAQSLRIIANKIIDEATTIEQSGKQKEARRLLKSPWALEQFHAFGLESEHQEAFEVVKASEGQKGSPMMPSERISVRQPRRESIAKPAMRGTVLRISDLFAREEEHGWVTRLPRRASMKTGDEQRRSGTEQKYAEDTAQRLDWLYDRMADQEIDVQNGHELADEYDNDLDDGDLEQDANREDNRTPR